LRQVLASRIARRLFSRARAKDVAERGLDEDVAVLFGLDDIVGSSRIWTLTPERARAELNASIAIADDPPSAPLTAHDLSVRGAEGALEARAYTPGGLVGPSPGVVFFHGGGWVTGDLDSHDTLCRRLALEAQVRVVAVHYRRPPEHPFPAAALDAIAAFRDVAARARELELDPARLSVAGDSAGGNLAAVVGLETRGDAIRPAAQMLLYPALDARRALASHTTYGEGYFLTSRSGDWYYGHYLGDDPAKRLDPRVSPLLAADVRGAPPALIAVAGFDTLRDEAEAYAERLADAGVPVTCEIFTALPHGFAVMAASSHRAMMATVGFARALGERLRGQTLEQTPGACSRA